MAETPPEDLHLLAQEFDRPVQLLAVGAVATEEGDYPMVVVDAAQLKAEIALGDAHAVSDVEEVARTIHEAGVDFPPGTRVMAVPTPELYFEPAGEVRCAGRSGTLGALVTSSAGNDAILTAGHVASAGAVARDGAGNTGQVQFSLDPARFPGAAITADVAVIESGHWTAGGPAISGQAHAQGRDSVTLFGYRSGQRTSAVQAYCSFFNTPSAGGAWAGVYMTAAGISQAGDSGGAVLREDTRELIGHLVGGSGAVTSYIQDIDVLLKACGATLR